MTDFEIISMQKFNNGRELYRYAQRNAMFRDALTRLTTKVLNRRLGSCSNCWFDSYVEIMAMDKTLLETRVATVARLKKNVLLYGVEGVHCGVVSNYNLTDEIAREYLRTHADGEKFFEVMPLPKGENEANSEPKNEEEQQPKNRGRKKKTC